MTLQANGAVATDAQIGEIIDTLAGVEGSLLPILHAVQGQFGHIPKTAIPVIAGRLNLSRAEVHGVVSFYHDFREAPAGRHTLKICRAEACQALGGEGAAERLLKHLGIDWNGTTADGSLTVEPVYCLGLCACAPSALLDGVPIGRLDDTRLVRLAEAAAR